MGLFHDAESAEKAHRAGQGAKLNLAIGGKSGLPGHHPVEAKFEVLAIGDGICRYSGEMYGGGIATLGKTAALRMIESGAKIDLVVTSVRNQCLDRAHFTHIGLNPTSYSVICVKSTTHFRADFQPIASDVKAVAAPGTFLRSGPDPLLHHRRQTPHRNTWTQNQNPLISHPHRSSQST